jgi:hypothetical protein
MKGKRLVDFGLYVLIGLAISIGAMVYASGSPSEKDVQLAIKWISLLAGTAIVFGLYVRKGARFQTATRFWMMTTGLLIIHFLIFISVIYRWPDLKIIWLFLLMWAESQVLSQLTSSAGRRF